jgi:hypothetical protein
LVDVKGHYEHVKVIRCDIKRESVKKCGGVKNEPVSGKKPMDTLGPHFSNSATFI